MNKAIKKIAKWAETNGWTVTDDTATEQEDQE